MMRGQVVRRFTWTVVLQMAVNPLHQYITPSHQVEVLYALMVDMSTRCTSTMPDL